MPASGCIGSRAVQHSLPPPRLGPASPGPSPVRGLGRSQAPWLQRAPPLLERTQLPFSVIGSLNGVHMFGSNLDVALTAARTEGTRVLWRAFHNSITLIVMSSEEGASDFTLSRLLDNVFSAMVLVLGLEELANIRNVERLKKDLRECLTAFTRAAESRFGCLLVGGRVAVATEPWWQLAPQEVNLLAWLVGSLLPSTTRDYPVYLPQGSPMVPHRLLTFQLLPGLDICLLCGPSPSLEAVKTELVPRFWKPLLEPLRACACPPSVPLHPGVLAFLLINREQKRSLSAVLPRGVQAEGPALPLGSCASVLRAFYALVVSHYFPCEGSPVPPLELPLGGGSHSAQHCYVVSAGYKAYAAQAPPHQLFLLLAPEVPTFALRPLATHILQYLVGDAAF
ncbi:protein fuzzy homolog isoform X3 [Alligator mississippiensis]|uniref:protein fuzzy homolog isoform X3 n=1 Tax=Alligator mississippiensis TaxID=8496 RepID=UPI002877949D|nr:protein fuzzy homolog isoform X3 [Alligator mississippiensis]